MLAYRYLLYENNDLAGRLKYMEDIKFIIGRKELKLGDDIEKAKQLVNLQYATISSDDSGKITIIALPIAAYSSIEFRGYRYSDLKELYEVEGIEPNELLFCCGTGDEMEIVKDIDLSLCEYSVTSKEECYNLCQHMEVYRDNGKLGFDMAQVDYKHGPSCCVIAKPGYAWRVNK